MEDTDEADVDNNAQRWDMRKQMLLDEFFYNVCYAFYGWQLRLFFIQQRHLPITQNERIICLIR
jgi:hypothetical protein